MDQSPRPSPSSFCPGCQQHTLGPVLECQGKGRDLLNYKRLYQRCDCGKHVWCTGRAALEDIPEEVQVNFAIKQSLEANGTDADNGGVPCAMPTCRNAKGVPRRSNTSCRRQPQYCSSCCKAGGGCPTHRLNGRDMPTVASVGGTSTTAVDATRPRSIYARPLSEAYARPYALAHTQRFRATVKVEAEATQQEIMANTFAVVVYRKDAPVPPEHFKLVAENHRFVPANHPAILSFAQNGLIAVLDSLAPPKWVNHDVRVGIQVGAANTRILLKVLDVVECLDVDVEITHLPPPPSPTRSSVPLGVALTPKVAPFDPDLDILPIDPPPVVLVSKGKFPLPYTCDMASPMAMLAEHKGKAIEKAFPGVFPSILFKKKTVYKHISFYNDALKLGLVSKLAALGRTEPGRWKHLVSAVEHNRKPGGGSNPEGMVIDLTEGRSTAAEIQSIVAQEVNTGVDGPQNLLVYDEFVPTNTFIMTMSEYRRRNGVVEDFHAGPTVTFDIFFDCVTGSRFNVHLGHFTHPEVGMLACVVKNMRDQDSMTVWVEGARSAEGKTLWENFQKECSDKNVPLPNIEFAATSLLIDSNADTDATHGFYLAQPFYNGASVNSNALEIDGAEFRNALSAFSHWTYKMSSYNSVYVDFEGFVSSNGYRVFDSKTHIMDLTDSVGTGTNFNFARSLGEHGVGQFRDTHNCNGVCGALMLGFLPVVFPPPRVVEHEDAQGDSTMPF
ncbi:hypothetical protein C8R46DRAFT_1196311 [Mycena filopes]|nr:hypothetical protein C8R46DRAFT_1196311 [Mycena filopes]